MPHFTKQKNHLNEFLTPTSNCFGFLMQADTVLVCRDVFIQTRLQDEVSEGLKFIDFTTKCSIYNPRKNKQAVNEGSASAKRLELLIVHRMDTVMVQI